MSNFADKLIDWYEENKRDLPWRDTKDPYRIWISEIILQQTRVAQGYGYFVRFMERFPDVFTLAEAEEDEVMKYWQGLGYYSRARNLHAAARSIADAGVFPATYEGVLALKGVGEYTAAAIASFAFGLKHAVVDGNVYRVLSRYFAIDIPIDTTEGKHYYYLLANDLLPERQSVAIYNQAIMDFGALQCVPKSPHCNACPLSDSCLAFNQSSIENYPIKIKKLEIKNRYLNYFILRTNDEIWLHRREGKDIWQGLYEPFLIETTDDKDLFSRLEHELARLFHFPTPMQQNVIAMNIRHQLTHRTLVCNFIEIITKQKPTFKEGHNGKWYALSEIEDLAFPKVIQKVMNLYSDNKRKKKNL
ncbi:MAG: A/G-specific adenine glycosylase [Paraprevotella sp.]|nr:A/G-specific adenine glycosylase [Paraprevotella sp.]